MGLFRLILLGLLVWLAVRFVRGLLPAGRAARQPPRRPERIDGGDLVEDPQCGVYVPQAHAVPGRAGRYFCSEACRDAYEGRRG